MFLDCLSVGLYCENTRGATIILEGVGSGVTHMLFSPDGNSLYVGLRKVSTINTWFLAMHSDLCIDYRMI